MERIREITGGSMIVYIESKTAKNEGGWVCKVADNADLTHFEFYVLNGMWHGLFVDGIVEISALDRDIICDDEYEVFVDHSKAEAYVTYHRQQCEKYGKFIPYNELNSDELL